METESNWVREELDKYRKTIPCNKCDGNRLKEEALAVKIHGKDISAISKLSILEALSWFVNLEKRLDKNPGYLIDQTFYTVENTREDSWTDDSYMTQFEREK